MIGLVLYVLLVLLAPQGNNQNAPDAPSPTPSSTPDERSHDEANTTIKNDLEDILSADPVLDDAEIHVAVDDVAITLTGTVQNEAQHQRALQLAHPYIQWRRVVDKITVR